MVGTDIFIALGIPAIVASCAIFTVALHQRGSAEQWRLRRQRVEIRLAFGRARQELFERALDGDIDFEGDIFKALYAVDTHIMRDLNSHQSLANAVAELGKRPVGPPGAVQESFRAFATSPTTAHCAALHAHAVQKLWMEHSFEATLTRSLPPAALPVIHAALQGLIQVLRGATWLVNSSGRLSRWAKETTERQAVNGWLAMLQPAARQHGGLTAMGHS